MFCKLLQAHVRMLHPSVDQWLSKTPTPDGHYKEGPTEFTSGNTFTVEMLTREPLEPWIPLSSLIVSESHAGDPTAPLVAPDLKFLKRNSS